MATLAIIAEGSVDAVTHRKVAARAGVSPGSTTHHFASRDELVREAFRHYIRIGEGKIRVLLDGASHADDPIGWVGEALATIVSRDFAGGLVRAEYELFLHACTDPDLALEVRAWEARVVGAIAEALERGGVNQPIVAGRTLLNLARGYELESMLDPTLDRTDFEDRVAIVLAALTDRS